MYFEMINKSYESLKHKITTEKLKRVANHKKRIRLLNGYNEGKKLRKANITYFGFVKSKTKNFICFKKRPSRRKKTSKTSTGFF